MGPPRLHKQASPLGRKEQLKRNAMYKQISQSAKQFAEFDHDGNQSLDFEEFLSMMPQHIRETHSAESIRAWFDAADTSGDGFLSIDEFFAWSLSNASEQHGAETLLAAFSKYDRNNSGILDAKEFQAACDEMGFGIVSHDIFRALDKNGSGCLSYRELAASLQVNADAANTDASTKRMLCSLVWSHESARANERERVLDTSGWRIRGHDPILVRQELQDLLKQSGAPVADLIKIFDQVRTRRMPHDCARSSSPVAHSIRCTHPRLLRS